MEESFKGSQESSTFAVKIFGVNPFPKDDVRRELWETNARYAAEEYARHTAKTLASVPTRGPATSDEEYVSWIIDGVSGQFDILAKRLLIFTVKGAASVILYEKFLARVVESEVARALEHRPSFITQELFSSELRLRFTQREAHWTAEALKLSREAESVGVDDGKFQDQIEKGRKVLEDSRRTLEALERTRVALDASPEELARQDRGNRIDGPPDAVPNGTEEHPNRENHADATPEKTTTKGVISASARLIKPGTASEVLSELVPDLALLHHNERENAIRTLQEKFAPKAELSAEHLKVLEEVKSQLQNSAESSPTDATEDKAVHLKGRRCHEVIAEMRKIKNLVYGFQRTVSEIRHDHPDFQVWQIADGLPDDDRDIFNHPRRWGAAVGYARNLLAKDYACRPDTIRKWVGAYRAANPDKRIKKATPKLRRSESK